MPAIVTNSKSTVPAAFAPIAHRLDSMFCVEINGAESDYKLYDIDPVAIIDMLPTGKLKDIKITLSTDYLIAARVHVKAQYSEDAYKNSEMRDLTTFLEPFDDTEWGIPWGWDEGGPLIAFTIVRPLWPEGV
jgi:hypothetical protein